MLKTLVTKIVKQIKFEGEWGELEAKYCFQRQFWPKYMRLDTREEDWVLDYNSMKICDLVNIS